CAERGAAAEAVAIEASSKAPSSSSIARLGIHGLCTRARSPAGPSAATRVAGDVRLEGPRRAVLTLLRQHELASPVVEGRRRRDAVAAEEASDLPVGVEVARVRDRVALMEASRSIPRVERVDCEKGHLLAAPRRDSLEEGE